MQIIRKHIVSLRAYDKPTEHNNVILLRSTSRAKLTIAESLVFPAVPKWFY